MLTQPVIKNGVPVINRGNPIIKTTNLQLIFSFDVSATLGGFRIASYSDSFLPAVYPIYYYNNTYSTGEELRITSPVDTANKAEVYASNTCSVDDIRSFIVQGDGIYGTVDVSTLTSIWSSSYGWVFETPNVDNIILPPSPILISTLTIDDSKITNLTLDGSISSLEIINNSSITDVSISGPTSTDNTFITNTDVSILDLNNLSVSRLINLSGNSNLVDVTLPDMKYTTNTFELWGCALNTETVDSLFSTMNSVWTANDPIWPGTTFIVIDGGTNASPTNGWANTDIVNIQNIFSVAGRDVSIHIN